MSATVRPIGPSTESSDQGLSVGQVGTRPGLGRSPTTLQNDAGLRSEPPMSLPSAIGTRPHASATARAAARAAARPVERVGVPRRPEHLVERLGAGPELGHVRLAHGDRACFVEPLDDQGGLGRDPSPVDRRAVGRPDAGGVVEILVCNWETVQHPAGWPLVGHARLCQRPLADECHDRVDLRVDALDLGQVSLHHLDGGELPRPETRCQLGRRQEAEPVAHSPRARSAGRREKMTQSERRPFTSSFWRRTPSRLKPAFSATRWEARFATSVRISTRTDPSSSNAQAARSRTARTATPRPRADEATQ